MPAQFELLAADIGQGNAVIVRTATHTLVYDSGPRYSPESDAGHRVLVPLLRALDERVDTLMLSHRDSDHTGGAAAVLAMQPQAALLSSIEDGHELQALRPSQRCAAGQRWQWDGVDFEVLHPSADDYQAANKSNAMSCVLRISNGAHTVLLAGDIEQAQEARLAQQGSGFESRPAAGAPSRQQDLVQRCLPGRGAALAGRGAGGLPQPLRASGGPRVGALSRQGHSRDRFAALRRGRLALGESVGSCLPPPTGASLLAPRADVCR